MARTAFFLALVTAINGCGRLYPTSEDDVRSYFLRHGQEVVFHSDSIHGRPFRWFDVNVSQVDTAPIVIFVHGGAGNANHFLHFMSDTLLNRNVRMIAFDRLGYAPFDMGESEVSIERQAQVIGRILGHYDYPWAVVVAHSYGGPIAMSHVIDHPEKLRAVLLLAPALDPVQEPEFSTVALTQWKATRWAIPKLLLVSADEHLAHREELELLRERYAALQPVPITHLHGTWDFIIPYGNVHFSERMVADSLLTVVTLPRGDHFLPWTAREEIRRRIVCLTAPCSFPVPEN